MTNTITQIDIDGVKKLKSGKVREVFDLGDVLLFVATDRISAFDVILPNPIPEKGHVLTALSEFWFGKTRHIVENHFITSDYAKLAARVVGIESLRGRSMLVRKCQPLPVECVVRGYLSGSGWKDYQQSGSICGIKLPAGLRESDRLPEPIFTPAAKIHSGGHDENISYEMVEKTIGPTYADALRSLTLKIYEKATEHAASKGLILADTKFEFGLVTDQSGDEQIILADEVLTPDSSRYWPADSYNPGGPQPSFDKQYVRDYLESIHWNKQAPAPALPREVVLRTSEKYLEAYRLLTGRTNL